LAFWRPRCIFTMWLRFMALAHFACWLRLGSMQDTQPQDIELSATIHLAFEEL
jgi:hypothetical protein